MERYKQSERRRSDCMSQRQRDGCRAVARMERYREAESAGCRRMQEDAAYMRMATAAVAFIGLIEAADWLMLIFL